MMRASAARSTSLTKSLRPFCSTLMCWTSSAARRMNWPAWRAARRAILTCGASIGVGHLLKNGEARSLAECAQQEQVLLPSPAPARAVLNCAPRLERCLDSTMLDRIRIVMVETTHPGNIGAAARAMNTMGLSDLRLIKPLQFPHVEATARASGSADILASARVCADLDEALAGATLVVGTSARQRRIPWPCLSPRQFGEVAAERVEHEQIAVLFGREDRG